MGDGFNAGIRSSRRMPPSVSVLRERRQTRRNTANKPQRPGRDLTLQSPIRSWHFSPQVLTTAQLKVLRKNKIQHIMLTFQQHHRSSLIHLIPTPAHYLIHYSQCELKNNKSSAQSAQKSQGVQADLPTCNTQNLVWLVGFRAWVGVFGLFVGLAFLNNL